MGNDERLSAIRERLAWLGDNDGGATVFGASQHRWQLAPPLSEDRVAVFEKTHGITLPAEYRAFLTTVGGGGAGPFYGLAVLEALERDTMPSHHVTITDADGDVLAEAGTGPRPAPDVRSSVARPFPLTEDWKLENGPAPIEAGTSVYDGCVYLCEQGCGYFDFLVVKGEAAGQVWSDYTAADGAMTKSADDFLSWYERWLEGAQIEWLERNAMDMALWAERNHPGIEECVRLLDATLERNPQWADGWRARGYVHLNREELELADAAFVKAAEHGRDDTQARLHLDRARIARFRQDLQTALAETEAGLAQKNLWASTKTQLHEERLQAQDATSDEEGALATLEALAASTYFTPTHHFRLAGRRLTRGEPELAWKVIDQAIADDVGPDRGRKKPTRHGMYGQLAAWLAEIGHEDLAALAREQQGPAPKAAWGGGESGGKSWDSNAGDGGKSWGNDG